MAKKNKPILEITVPVATLKNNDGTIHTKIFILNEGEKFRFPGVKEDSPRAWYYGPSLILQTNQGGMHTTNEYYIDNKGSWNWMEALMQIGFYAMGDKELSKQIPDELKSYWKH